MALLAIPLAATTLATPFTPNPLQSTNAPVVVQHASWLQDRLNGVTESFFGATAPARGSRDGSRVELGLRFKTRVSGTVTDIRFYKGSGNSGIHVGKLWDASGKLLSSVTFTNETSRGWQQATLAKAVRLSAATTYVVSYLAPKGHFSADQQYFATSRSTKSLYAFADSEGHNGVYKYGGGFPTSSTGAVNYYVDLVFKADVTGHTSSPPPPTQAPPTQPPTTAPPTTPATSPPASPPPVTTTPTTRPPSTTQPTQAPTTTAPKPSTTMAAPPAGGGVTTSKGCVFSSPVTVAFCDSFDAPQGDPATRSGDLNAQIWGVSRSNTLDNIGQGAANPWLPSTLVGCGAPQVVTAPRDVRICNGRALTAVSDGGGQPILAIYPKQPFDIAGGRTGTIVFDVGADSKGTHAAWPEFWWTDQPVPAPHAGELSAQEPFARNSYGFSVAAQCGNNGTTLDRMAVTRNYVEADLPMTVTGCVTKGSATGGLNHFEVKISQSRVEVWASDAGSTAVRMIAYADNANLTMTRGLVWLEQVHYNACKLDGQCDHTIAWDNLGWDGPAPYRDLSFDVADNTTPHDGATTLGWIASGTPIALKTVPVYRLQTPTAAIVTFNWFPETAATVPSIRLNGGAWHDTPWPFQGGTYSMRTIAVSVPVGEVVDGVNTIEVRSDARTVFSNVNVILIAGSPAN